MEMKRPKENKSESEENESEQDSVESIPPSSMEAESSLTGNLHYLINQVYYSWIIEHVRFPEIIPKMITLMRPIAGKVLASDRDGKSREAGILFMNFLMSIDSPGKYQYFLQALRDLNYTHIVKAIEGGEVRENHDDHKKILDVFLGPLTDKLDPTLMANELLAQSVISSQDFELIRNVESNQNTSDAVFILLDAIPRRSENWYTIFLKLLYEHGHHRLCKEIDPKFYDLKLAVNSSGDIVDLPPPVDLSLRFQDSNPNMNIGIHHPSQLPDSDPLPEPRAAVDVSNISFIRQTKENSSDHEAIPDSMNNKKSLSVACEFNCSCGAKIEELKTIFETKVSVLESKIDHLTSLLKEMANK